jgi:hypothetical protein
MMSDLALAVAQEIPEISDLIVAHDPNTLAAR